jgi:hypothetical protein
MYAEKSAASNGFVAAFRASVSQGFAVIRKRIVDPPFRGGGARGRCPPCAPTLPSRRTGDGGIDTPGPWARDSPARDAGDAFADRAGRLSAAVVFAGERLVPLLEPDLLQRGTGDADAGGEKAESPAAMPPRPGQNLLPY